MADFLNNTFRGFDYSVFKFVHDFAVNTDNFFTPFMKVISFLGVHGWFFIALTVVLALFRKTRRQATTAGFALVVGYIIVNLIVKNLVKRGRPFTDTSMPYAEWRSFVYPDGYEESGYSFPSGHTNTIVVFCLGLMINMKSKYKYLMFIGIFIMGFSRIYLFAHYTTDVLGGILFGTISSMLAHFIELGFRKLLIRFKDWKLVRFYENFDIIELFSGIFKNNRIVK